MITNKSLNYLTLHVMCLYNIFISPFKLNYWNKWTFTLTFFEFHLWADIDMQCNPLVPLVYARIRQIYISLYGPTVKDCLTRIPPSLCHIKPHRLRSDLKDGGGLLWTDEQQAGLIRISGKTKPRLVDVKGEQICLQSPPTLALRVWDISPG